MNVFGPQKLGRRRFDIRASDSPISNVWFLILIIRIVLLQVWVGPEVGRRDWENVKMLRTGSAVGHTAFPRPCIIGVAEFAKANQIGAAMAFPVKFAGALVKDEVQCKFIGRDIARSAGICPFANFIDVF